MDGAVVVLYKPIEEEFNNILSFANDVSLTYLIDNSKESHIEEYKRVSQLCKNKIIYEHHPENPGLCKGMNIGLKKLYEKGCQWALTMNPDSRFSFGSVEVFQRYVNDNDIKDIAILAPVYTYDRAPRKKYDGYRFLDRVMMSGNYINLNTFFKIGGFYEALFVDGLDNDYCIRLKKHGYKILECGQSIMQHMPAQTRKLTFFGKEFLYGYDKPTRYYGHARALSYIFKTHFTAYEFAFYWYKLFKIIFLFDNKKHFVREYFRGTVDGLRIPRMIEQDVRE